MDGNFDRDWEKHGKGKLNNQNFMPGSSVRWYINRQIRRAYDWIMTSHSLFLLTLEISLFIGWKCYTSNCLWQVSKCKDFIVDDWLLSYWSYGSFVSSCSLVFFIGIPNLWSHEKIFKYNVCVNEPLFISQLKRELRPRWFPGLLFVCKRIL